MDKDSIASQMVLRNGVGQVVQSPIGRMAVRYWWLSIPVALGIWGKYMERKEKGGKIKFHHFMVDAGAMLAPVGAVIGIAEFARRDEERRMQPAATAAAPKAVTIPGGSNNV